jgi:hypothetical protein
LRQFFNGNTFQYGHVLGDITNHGWLILFFRDAARAQGMGISLN